MADFEDVDSVLPDDDDAPEGGYGDIPEGYTAEEWLDLSEAEREGILSSDDDVLDADALAAIAGDDDDDDDIDTDPVGATPAAAVQSVPSAPIVLSDKVPEDLQAKLADLDDKYEQGEYSLAEYNQQRDAVNREITNFQIQEGYREQSAREWSAQQDAFFKANGHYLKEDAQGQIQYNALNVHVKEIAKANPNLSGDKVLAKAHEAVQKMFGKAPATPDPKTPTAKPKQPLPDMQTLTKVPISAKNATEDPFAAIDKLSGEAFESALERLSLDQLKAYRARV